MIAGPMNPTSVKRGETIELTLDSAAYEGVAVGRVEGFVVFVRDAVPGDRVLAIVRKKKKNFAEAVVEEVLEPSPHRVEPLCRHFGVCGGCRWQNAEYSLQLEFKRRQVEDLLHRIGGLSDVVARPTLASPDPYYYRNKMEFTFGSNRWLTAEEIAKGGPVDRDFALGLHIPKRFDRILDLQECHLLSLESAKLVNRVRELAREWNWSPYDTKTHQGYLRNLVIRLGRRTGQMMVNLVTNGDDPARLRRLTRRLLAEFPSMTTLVNSVNQTRSPVAAGQEHIYHGEGYVMETIGGLRLRVMPTTFFQPNTEQAERLYGVVGEFAAVGGDDTLFDLYSGIGSIGLFLAPAARCVVGVEQQAAAVEEARRNAVENQIENAFFHTGDADQAFQPGLLQLYGNPTVLVADPPRVGLGHEVCQAVLRILPKRVVYVSCNPATQARDLQVLSGAYSVSAVQPVDMFPQTHHIENVVKLERVSTGPTT